MRPGGDMELIRIFIAEVGLWWPAWVAGGAIFASCFLGAFIKD